ncbi:hypothetical protein PPGU19_008640 [Paraburkholderia sp. PGU19]|nr:hypothetical protein PPGU19_008640 [Paraburkholderia sp. PGU19]
MRIGRGAGVVGVDLHEDGRALAGGIGDAFQRRFDERAAGGAASSEIGGELGERREGR